MKKELCHNKKIPLEYFTTCSITASFKTPQLELFSVASIIPQYTELFKSEVACPNSNSDHWNNYNWNTLLNAWVLRWEGFSKGDIICWRWYRYLRCRFFDLCSPLTQTNTVLRVTFRCLLYPQVKLGKLLKGNVEVTSLLRWNFV